MVLIDAMGEAMRKIKMLKDNCTSKDQRICTLEVKVEQGETSLLKVCEALSCCCQRLVGVIKD